MEGSLWKQASHQHKGDSHFIAVAFIFSSFVIHESSQLFRFCHRGVWHELQEQDCPYGLLFNTQLQTPCFYVKEVNEVAPTIWPTLCEDPYLNYVENVTDATQGDGFFLAQKNGELRMVQYGKTGNISLKTVPPDDIISLQSCEDRCYRNIFDEKQSSPLLTSSSHEASDSLEAPHHVSRPKLSKSAFEAMVDQTLRLGDYLFDQIASPEENPGPKLRIVELFKRSIKILSKSCQHPFISTNFINRVLYGFLFLVSDSGIGELGDISVEEFEEIMVALNGCDEKNPDFRLEGTVCETNAIVKEVIKIMPNGTEFTAPFQLSPSKDGKNSIDDDEVKSSGRGKGSFPYDELDVFTEAAWSAVQVTHATCFATFKPNANMHHRYVSAMEQLFSGKIQDRWRNPTRLIDDRMWGTWFLSDVDVTFTNLQACIRAAYLDAPFVMRLDRPIDPVRSPKTGGAQPQKRSRRRRKRAVVVEGKVDEKDPETYWDTYRAGGGIRYRMAGEVQCFQNPDDREKAIQPLREQCR